MARPSLYETKWKDKLIVIQGWARDGLTNQQIAHNMGISAKTLYEWQNKYSEFGNTLKEGKEVVDRQVENALLKRALGYSVEEVTRERLYVRDAEGKQILDADGMPMSELVITKKVTKHIAPDTTAQIFWLKNRKPNEWRDKKEVGVTVDKSLEDYFGDAE